MDAEEWAKELRNLSEDGKFEVALSGSEATEIATILEAKKEAGDGSSTD
jgi:hypothetical protein